MFKLGYLCLALFAQESKNISCKILIAAEKHKKMCTPVVLKFSATEF